MVNEIKSVATGAMVKVNSDSHIIVKTGSLVSKPFTSSCTYAQIFLLFADRKYTPVLFAKDGESNYIHKAVTAPMMHAFWGTDDGQSLLREIHQTGNRNGEHIYLPERLFKEYISLLPPKREDSNSSGWRSWLPSSRSADEDTHTSKKRKLETQSEDRAESDGDFDQIYTFHKIMITKYNAETFNTEVAATVLTDEEFFVAFTKANVSKLLDGNSLTDLLKSNHEPELRRMIQSAYSSVFANKPITVEQLKIIMEEVGGGSNPERVRELNLTIQKGMSIFHLFFYEPPISKANNSQDLFDL